MRTTLLRLCPLLALSLVLSWGRPAAAVDIKPGQDVALGISSSIAAGSVISIVGNAVTLGQGKPNRSWIITGYFFGALNLAISPLLFVYGRGPDTGSGAPDTAFGVGLGAMHAAVGITNFALSIYGGVLWRRALRAKEAPSAAAPGAQLSLVPLLGRDSSGGSVAGLSLRLSRF